VTLSEADTDGVSVSVPGDWTEADERRVVTDAAALLPPLVHLEFDGREAAMLSHEAKAVARGRLHAALRRRGPVASVRRARAADRVQRDPGAGGLERTQPHTMISCIMRIV
jgi:hypothetical protein